MHIQYSIHACTVCSHMCCAYVSTLYACERVGDCLRAPVCQCLEFRHVLVRGRGSWGGGSVVLTSVASAHMPHHIPQSPPPGPIKPEGQLTPQAHKWMPSLGFVPFDQCCLSSTESSVGL